VAEWLDAYGLVVLFGILALQAAGIGGPPGKTALIAAAILAARGHFSIAHVVAVAVVAIALGGFVGYAIGRVGGRPLLRKPVLARRLGGTIERTERFFDAHGGKAVFLARFLPGLKVVAAPAAGVFGLGLPSFALWHVAAAVGFAVGFGLGAYYVGEGTIELVEAFGVYGLLLAAAVAALAWLAYDRLWLRRRRRAAVSTL
jgi:membrane protein DedA with SNARE-associated domain